MKIGIVVITYNRLESLKRCLKVLENATYPNSTDLIISIDKSDTDIVEKFADSYHWSYGKYAAIKHEKNLGLRKHVLSIGNHLDEYDALVVLEDDITVAPSFIYYTEQCVAKYCNDDRIAGISLYQFNISYQTRLPFEPLKAEYDVYMMNCAMSWGQVWMRNQWKDFIEWYKTHNEDFKIQTLPQIINLWRNKSWLKYHTRYCIENNKYLVFPYYALATNNSEVGTHVNNSDTQFQTIMQGGLKKDYILPSFEECIIKYDGFFEPKFLGKVLNISDDELCVNFYGYKNPVLFKRYVLTSIPMKYKIVKTYGLTLHPFELNILYDNKGRGVYLYDTTTTDKQPYQNKVDYYEYFYKDALSKVFSIIGAPTFANMCFLNFFLE